MTDHVDLEPVATPSAWRGDELRGSTRYIYVLTQGQVDELEAVGSRFVAENPDVREVSAADYPLPQCAPALAAWADELDHGLGFALVRGLRTDDYRDGLSGAIFFLLGLHFGAPMRQNRNGDVLTHVIATSDKAPYDPTVLSSRTTGGLTFHSDSSDVVGLLCLRAAAEGGASLLASGATIYNEVLRRRPELAPLLFEPFHFDWLQQDHNAPAATYRSPMCSYVDGVFSMYGGSKIVFTAQRHDGVPRLTTAQEAALALVNEIAAEPGVALEMDFQPGDIQWLLNYSALHSRTEYRDHPEPERRRHLLRLWLKRDVGRPIAQPFGKPVQDRAGEHMLRPTIDLLVEAPEREPAY